MKYTKKEIKSVYGSKINKFADQEYWKRKKNIALHKQSRSENKYVEYEYEELEYEVECEECSIATDDTMYYAYSMEDEMEDYW